MKLLLDENLSHRLVPFLQHDYPGTSQVVLLGHRVLIEEALLARGQACIEISSDA